MALVAACQLLFHRWSGQDDVAVGTVVSGRERPGLEPPAVSGKDPGRAEAAPRQSSAFHPSAWPRGRARDHAGRGAAAMMAAGVVLLSFMTGLGAAIVGLIVVLISVMVVGLALRSQP